MKIGIIGQGGHSKVIQDLILENKEISILGFFDDKYKNLYEIENKYFGPVNSIIEYLKIEPDSKLIIAIGNNKIRKKIVSELNISLERFATIVHSSAIISPSVKIGFGTVISANAVVNAETIIGNHAIINTGTVVEHDNRIGDFSHISPNATLTGNVIVEEGVHIGAGATVIPNTKIKEWSVIGAGATVISEIPSYTTAVGVPAKIQKRVVL